jgi:hypothetical protein
MQYMQRHMTYIKTSRLAGSQTKNQSPNPNQWGMGPVTGARHCQERWSRSYASPSNMRAHAVHSQPSLQAIKQMITQIIQQKLPKTTQRRPSPCLPAAESAPNARRADPYNTSETPCTTHAQHQKRNPTRHPFTKHRITPPHTLASTHVRTHPSSRAAHSLAQKHRPFASNWKMTINKHT